MKYAPKALLALLFAVAVTACELAVDFDRSKIPSESSDASLITPVNDSQATTGDDASTAPTDAAASSSDASLPLDAAAAPDAASSSDSGVDASTPT